MQTVPGRKKLTLLGQDFAPKPGSVIKMHKLNLYFCNETVTSLQCLDAK